MINLNSAQFYKSYVGVYLADYIKEKRMQDGRLNLILFIFFLTMLIVSLGISKPIFAKTDTGGVKVTNTGPEIYIKKNFEENIKNKYAGSYVTFPTEGMAHIKKVKYINSKPIRINIVELNTNVNPNLKIKPKIASNTLNHKTTVRRIAQKENSILAVNGGFFKPQTGVPLGALMIDGKVLTGPIYNRVGIAIFDEDDKTSYKMLNINFDISAITPDFILKIDNINQPRMLSTHTLMYTSDWGKISPPPPNGGYNLLIKNNKPVMVSSNPVEITEDSFVISAQSDKIFQLKKQSKIKINIKLQDEIQNAKHIIGAGPYLVKNSQIYVDYKTQKLQDEVQGAKHIIGAGPFLVKNSQVYVDFKAQKLQAISGKNPRSAIGFKKDGTFVIVTVDGREQNSVGMTLYELANLMKNIGCEYAMNFDGGSSSAMYIKGKIVNNAVNKEGIAVSNALIVNEVNPDNIQISSL